MPEILLTFVGDREVESEGGHIPDERRLRREAKLHQIAERFCAVMFLRVRRFRGNGFLQS